MDVLSLHSVLDTVISDEAGAKNLSGPVTSFEEAFSDRGLGSLERAYDGMFGYLAFFPGADSAVTKYVKAGTLASDSGPHCLVMFSLDQTARWPSAVSVGAFESWLQLDHSEHPSYTFARAVFGVENLAPIPSLILFSSWTKPEHAVAVMLDELRDDGEVRTRLRQVFGIVEGSRDDGDRTKWTGDIAARLAKARIPYRSSSGPSVRERLWKAGYFATDNLDKIVAVVGLAL